MITAAALIVLAILAIILGDIIINGFPALSWDFLTQAPSNLGRSGGIFPAIVGTLYLVTGAILIALPLGVGAAVYLVEYTREGRITKLIRTGVDLLNGTPSIVFGLFGFAFLGTLSQDRRIAPRRYDHACPDGAPDRHPNNGRIP